MANEQIGNYNLANCLMTGINSQVWEVVERSSQRHFAMKILLPGKHTDPAMRRLLFHEAHVGQQLTHPNVVKIVYVSPSSEKFAYFCMEFFPAGSLKSRLQQKHYDFVDTHLRAIMKQTATALAYMNASGWLHRDVKPDNLLVSASGELRLIDFAIARPLETPGILTKLKRLAFGRGPIQGTRSYMSPEQIRNEVLDTRADIYSFGATVYELAARRAPFRAASQEELLLKQLNQDPDPLSMHAPKVTAEFERLVMKMLEKKREKRPASFHEILKTLNTLTLYKQEPARAKSTPG